MLPAEQLTANRGEGLDFTTTPPACQHKFHREITAFHFRGVLCAMKEDLSVPDVAGSQYNLTWATFGGSGWLRVAELGFSVAAGRKVCTN
ncbi:hypothetical protein MHEC_01480 [Mycobacterium heckeshornense]|uniref:Uncharacterized protein n=1 Tax=Mycobacterium heckeshornense TaxID=110505 RepID=A0A7R7GPG9_9MYCO|nr:hypothetical protein MHEC_01480 [Mycobacterium heckeshornense]